MYEQVGDKSRAIANSVAQKKSGVKQSFGFVDNRPQIIESKKHQEAFDYYSQHNSPVQQVAIQRKIVIGLSEFETLEKLREAWSKKFDGYNWSDTWDSDAKKWIESNHEFVNFEDLRNQLTKDRSTQGAGLYVVGEVPNRVLHQQNKNDPTPIRGDHFELNNEATKDTKIPPYQGGVSSSDIESQNPNYRGEQFRASSPVPPGWELRNDGAEVNGSQSKGHYSFRPTEQGKTLEDAGKANNDMFRESIGVVEQTKAQKKKREHTWKPKKDGSLTVRPMATTWTGQQPPGTENAESDTKKKDGTRSDSSTQTHYRSPMNE